MSTTNIQERKLELIQWLSVIEDVSLIEKISELKEQSARDWWEDVSSAEKESIARGIEDADAGRLRPHSEAKTIYEKRL